MAKQDLLLRLIKTLSPGERRNFRLLSKLQAGEKKYVQLFDVLEETETYNAGAISKQLNVTTAQLAVLKNYLNQALLESLRSADPLIYNRMLGNDMDVRELVSRDLYESALVLADKTLVEVYKFEQFTIALSVLQAKRDCLFYMEKHDELLACAKEMKLVGQKINEINELRELRERALIAERERNANESLKPLLNHPLIKKKPEKLLSLRAVEMKFNLEYAYQYVTQKADGMVATAKQQWQFYLQRPQIKFVSPWAYTSAYVNLYRAYQAAGRYEEALEQINGCNKLIFDRELRANKAHVRTYASSAKVNVLFKLNRFKEAAELAAENESSFKQTSSDLHVEGMFNHAAALVHLRKSKQATDKINQLLAINTGMRKDLQQHMRILQIMVQIDMGNYSLVPYLIKSAKAWMKRNKFTNKEFDLFFTLIASATKSLSGPNTKGAWTSLNKAIDSDKLTVLEKAVSLKQWLQESRSTFS
ncbi:MAG: hypothetical protein KA149_01955 [Chitinophagales bacterium]|jgi:hypothetical protein|nr:hypothetical protein [Chitinophagales bacterium]